MLKIQENHPLKEHNTFGIEATAQYFVELKETSQLEELLTNQVFKETKKRYLIGGGSNIIITKDLEGLVIKNSIKGIEVVSEDKDSVYLNIGAGEDWTELVDYTVDKNWGGLENMALIPGTVGAAPVQNISAYGGSISDVLEYVETFSLETGKRKSFTTKECEMGYRDSTFKQQENQNLIIISIQIKLSKPTSHEIKTGYTSRYDTITEELRQNAKEPYTVKDIAEAVKTIRKRKLPSIYEFGSVGSTFKNPIVSVEKQEELAKKYPELPAFKQEDGRYKIPSGWILEEIGWKNRRLGNAGTWSEHALVVTNFGGATSQEILNVIHSMQKDFKDATGVDLELETEILE